MTSEGSKHLLLTLQVPAAKSRDYKFYKPKYPDYTDQLIKEEVLNSTNKVQKADAFV